MRRERIKEEEDTTGHLLLLLVSRVVNWVTPQNAQFSFADLIQLIKLLLPLPLNCQNSGQRRPKTCPSVN
jgi:hypothetical protein